MSLACLRKRYPLDIPESPRDISVSTQLAPFYFFFSTDIPRNILLLARAFLGGNLGQYKQF